jgi:hypothetical protein
LIAEGAMGPLEFVNAVRHEDDIIIEETNQIRLDAAQSEIALAGESFQSSTNAEVEETVGQPVGGWMFLDHLLGFRIRAGIDNDQPIGFSNLPLERIKEAFEAACALVGADDERESANERSMMRRRNFRVGRLQAALKPSHYISIHGCTRLASTGDPLGSGSRVKVEFH